MAALYRNATNYTVSFSSAASQVQLMNHSFKKHSVKLQIILRQSCSKAVPSALRLPSESFSFSRLLQRTATFGWAVIFRGTVTLGPGINRKVKKIRYFRGPVIFGWAVAFGIAKRARPKNRMQMIISPTRLIQHQRVLRELEGI